MFLNVYACASEYNTVIEFIEIQLKDGRILTLNWDESDNSDYERIYKGVHFSEPEESVSLEILKGMKVKHVELYSESSERLFITIDRMEFNDDSGNIAFVCPYTNYLSELSEEERNKVINFVKEWLKKYDYDLKGYYPYCDDPETGCCNVDIANDMKSDFEESDLNPLTGKDDPMYPAEFDRYYDSVMFELIIPAINETMRELYAQSV